RRLPTVHTPRPDGRAHPPRHRTRHLALGRRGARVRPGRRGHGPVKRREAVGEALRRRRQAQGRTLREVAAAAGVSLTYLSEVERGRKEASSEVLEAVCAALRLGLAELFFEVAETLAAAEAAPVPASGVLVPAR